MDEQKIRIIKVLTVSAVIFLLILLSAMIINFITIAQKSTEEKRLNNELSRLNSIIEMNNDEIDYKETDAFIEKYSRDHHNLIRKDEEVFVSKK